MEQLLIIKINFVRIDCGLSNEHFTIVSGSDTVILTQQCSQKPFLSACFIGESRLLLLGLDQKFLFGGTICCEEPYLEFLFRHFKLFRLDAVLHDAAGAVQAHSGQWPDYC